MGDEPGVRRWRVRFASWSCDWPARIRAGAISALSATESTRDCGVRDDRSEAPARSTSWAGAHALWTDWARVLATSRGIGASLSRTDIIGEQAILDRP
jgi:hypothetical protein